MTDSFTLHDLLAPNSKKSTRSAVLPLKCYVCKRELDATSISGKVIGGKVVFLCPAHLKSEMPQLMGVK